MDKINIKTEVVNVLDAVASLKDFSTSYPEEMTEFPYAVYRTVATPHFIDGERNEVQTKWLVLIEIYGIRSVSGVSNQIYQKMKKLGFSVIQRDSNIPGFFRIVLECHGIVDNKEKQIYL